MKSKEINETLKTRLQLLLRNTAFGLAVSFVHNDLEKCSVSVCKPLTRLFAAALPFHSCRYGGVFTPAPPLGCDDTQLSCVKSEEWSPPL